MQPDDDHDLHARFGDVLKEIPEAEGVLRAWHDRQRAEARRKIIDDFWAKWRALANGRSDG
jgi:hypothetical protein